MILITLQWYKGNFGFGLAGQVYPFDTYKTNENQCVQLLLWSPPTQFWEQGHINFYEWPAFMYPGGPREPKDVAKVSGNFQTNPTSVIPTVSNEHETNKQESCLFGLSQNG